MRINLRTPCPCQSGQHYHQCCYALIEKRQAARTAEQLMRSRYTAYHLKKIKYIAKTMRGPAKQGFNLQSTQKWADQLSWQSLNITRTVAGQPGDQQGWVAFEAVYLDGQQQSHTIQEISVFYFENRWYYTEQIPDWSACPMA